MAKEYIIQKAVAPEKVVKKNRRTIEELALTHEAQTKNDGCCAVMHLLKIGPNSYQTFTESRTGEDYVSMQEVERQAQEFFKSEIDLYNGLVLIGEAWWPGKGEFNHISGEFRRGKVSDKLCLVINDCLTKAEFEAGFTDVPYYARMARVSKLASVSRWAGYRFWLVRRYGPGNYGDPRDLCSQLVDQGGYDGLILRDPNAGWKRGSGTEGGIIKLKRELSYDLRVTEVNTAVGEKTGRTVYKLVVDFKGKPLGVGSGVPHKFEEVPKVGDIVEVCAMDYSSDGLLREPRYKGIRHDKVEPDA